MLISICIPCYRSENTLPNVISDIKKEFLKYPEYSYQIILINDGSPDNTFETIKQLCQNDKNIVGVSLSRNYGQNIASMAAFRYVKGDIAVFMDDDGQHPVDGIFKLVNKINEGFDVVYAHLEHKKHSFFKRFTSSVHHKLSEWIKTKPKGIYISAFCAFSRLMVNSILKYDSPFPSHHTFVMHVTTKFANISIEHQERLEGNSRYTLGKLFSLWLTSFTSFSIVPLRLAAGIGAICALVGFMGGLLVIIRKFINPDIAAGYTSLVALLLFIGGIIMMLLGLVGEYIGRIYMTISNKPQYIVRENINT